MTLKMIRKNYNNNIIVLDSKWQIITDRPQYLSNRKRKTDVVQSLDNDFLNQLRAKIPKNSK